jgi:hypothetical protein
MKRLMKNITITLGLSGILVGAVSLHDIKYREKNYTVNKASISSTKEIIIDITSEDVISKNIVQKSCPQDLLETISNICEAPRNYGTEGNLKAQKYLVEKMNTYGYETYLQTFPIYKKLGDSFSIIYEEYDASTLLGYSENIIATKKGLENDKKIILCAHYDSTANNVGVLDNASGVATVLEIARCLQNYSLPYGIDIIFFSAEEQGCVGSKYYLENLTNEEKNNIAGVINIDMVGEKYGSELIMGTYPGRPNLLTFLMNEYLKDEMLPVQSFIGASDDYHFFQNNIPTFTLINKKNTDLNSKTYEEQLKNLDINKLADIADTIAGFLVWLDIEYLESQTMTYKSTFLESKEVYTHPLFDYIDKFTLPNFSLQNIEFRLIADGSSSELIYKFTNTAEEYYYIIQVPIQYKSTYSKYSLNNKGYGDFLIQFEKEGSIYFEIINGFLSQENKEMIKKNLDMIK